MRPALLTLLVLLAPTSALAARGPAVFDAGRTLVVASSSPGNAYFAGASVVETASVAGDLSALGGSVIAAGPVAGDVLLLAGSASARGTVAGDLRALGGTISAESRVTGDAVLLGYSVRATEHIGGSALIAAVDATLVDGAGGPVTVYGNEVELGGTFGGNVRVVATGHVTLDPGTAIAGKLIYESPEPAAIPASASIAGGVEYTNASYLPDAGTSRTLALVSVGFFLFVRILGALILAGLLAGLFPRFAELVVERAYAGRARSVLLTTLLGFGILVATPVLIILLALTFVGLGLALLLGILYALLVLLAFLYAGILLGSSFARRVSGRTIVLWRDGVLGMLSLSLIALVPFIGVAVALILAIFTAGALLQLFFRFAFPHDE